VPAPVWGAAAGGALGGVLGAFLRAFDEALAAFPGIVAVGACGLAGTAVGAVLTFFPGTPGAVCVLAGAVFGVLFAALFRWFGDLLP
jgi:hypothetical protein